MGGRKINNLRYADDTTLLAESKEELLQLVTSVREKSAQVGLYLNLKKTKVMSTEEIEEFELDGENVEILGILSSSEPKLKTLNQNQKYIFGHFRPRRPLPRP